MTEVVDSATDEGTDLEGLCTSSQGLLFTGSVTPHDLATGAMTVDISQEPDAWSILTGELFIDGAAYSATAQAWRIYQSASALLQRNGSDLSHLVRQRIFVHDLADVPAVERVMDAMLPERPATVIVSVVRDGVDPRVRVSMDFVAAIPGESSDGIRRIFDPDSPESRYPLAVRAAGYVFTSALAGIDEAGRLARGRDDLGDAAADFSDYQTANDRQEAVLAQSALSMRRIGRALELAGTSLESTLRVNAWVTIDTRDYDPIRVVRGRVFPRLEDKTTSIGLTMSALPGDGNIAMFDAIAAVPSQGIEKSVAMAPSNISDYFVGALAAGNLVITCGEVPIDFSGELPRVISRPEEGRNDSGAEFLGRVDPISKTQVQAAHVYGTLRSYLRQYESDLDQAIHQTVYLVDVSDYPAVSAIAKHYFGNSALPPTTIVPIRETSPFRTDVRIEIDMIASRVRSS